MAGIEGRVQTFLNSWLKVKEQLEEIPKDEEGPLYNRGVGRSLPAESKDNLPAPLGKTDPGL
jgi:hypothetical protein